MFQENELVMVILGLGVLLFIHSNYRQLQRLPSAPILLGSFYLFFAGCFFTVMESFFLADTLNLLEHFSYVVSSTLLAVWCWQTFHPRRNKP